MSTVPNRREFTRVTVMIHVELRTGGNVVIHGEIQNVSYKGVLLNCDAIVPEQTPCLVLIHLDGGQGGPTIEAQGLVVRTEKGKIAVEFVELLGAESAHHLKKLVLYNCGSQIEQVEEEFESHLGLQTKS